MTENEAIDAAAADQADHQSMVDHVTDRKTETVQFDPQRVFNNLIDCIDGRDCCVMEIAARALVTRLDEGCDQPEVSRRQLRQLLLVVREFAGAVNDGTVNATVIMED